MIKFFTSILYIYPLVIHFFRFKCGWWPLFLILFEVQMFVIEHWGLHRRWPAVRISRNFLFAENCSNWTVDWGNCPWQCLVVMIVERVMTINYSWFILSLYKLQSLTQFEIWFQKLEFKWIVFHLVCDTSTGSSLFLLKPNNYKI